MKVKLNHLILVLTLLMTAAFGQVAEKAPELIKNFGISTLSTANVKATEPFYVIRHGQTDYNVKEILQGSTDNPLNEKGKAQALEAAQALKGIDIQKIYSSPLSRAKETAEIIRKELNIKDPVIIIAGLKERDWGELEGKKDNVDPKKDSYDYTPKGGEALISFNDRIVKAYIDIINKNQKGVLIVAHWGVIRNFSNFIGGAKIEIDNAVPIEFISPAGDQKEWKFEQIKDGKPVEKHSYLLPSHTSLKAA